MKKFHCETLQVKMDFSEADFKAKEFRKEIECKNKKQEFFVFHHNSKFKTKKEHAHLEIVLDDEDSFLRLSFHPQEITEEDNEMIPSDIPTEEVFNYLMPFFKKDEFESRILCHFNYGKDYEPVLKMQYPLLVKNEKLATAMVTGHEISFSDSKVRTALLTLLNETDLSLILGGRYEIVLANFSHHKIIKYFAEYAEALVEKKD